VADQFDELEEKCHAEPAWAARRIRELERQRQGDFKPSPAELGRTPTMPSPIFSTFCPFCAGGDTAVQLRPIGLYAVRCEACEATGPRAASPEAAAQKWNAAWERITRLNAECTRERSVVEQHALVVAHLAENITACEAENAELKRRVAELEANGAFVLTQYAGAMESYSRVRAETVALCQRALRELAERADRSPGQDEPLHVNLGTLRAECYRASADVLPAAVERLKERGDG